MLRLPAPSRCGGAVEALSLLSALAAPFVAFFAKVAWGTWGFGLGAVVAGAWIIVPTYVILVVLTLRRLLSGEGRLLPGRVLVSAWGFAAAIIGLALGVEDGGAEDSTRGSVLGDLAARFGLRWAVVEPAWGPTCFVLTVACCLWLIVELIIDSARRHRTTLGSARP